MTVHQLSRADARRIAVRAQLLDGSRPAGLHDVVRRAETEDLGRWLGLDLSSPR